MVIRQYNESDQQGVVDLWKLCFPGQPAHNDPVADINRKMKIQKELFIVAEEEGHIIGSAMAGFDGHRGWVYYVAAHPEYQRRGIGSKLMAEIETGLKAIGCPKLNLQVRADNTEVVAFYRSIGYDIEERVSMAKKLT